MIETTLAGLTLNITDGKHGDCQGDDNSGFYFISCKDVKDGQINYSDARQITEKDFWDAHKRTMLEPNDILVTNSGTIGRMAFIRDTPKTSRTTFQKSVAVVKPNKEKVLPLYLYYQLQNYVADFINQSNGSAQKNLLLSTMRAFKLHIHATKKEQQHIADILSAYDNLIENNQKQIKLLEEAAQRLYKEWFVDLRFPGHEMTPVVDGVPKGWRYRTVAEFGDVITGKTPSTSKAEYYGGTIPFVTIPDMHNQVYPLLTEKTLTSTGADTQKNKFIPAKSILVSCIATVGLVNIAFEKCQTNQQINSVVLFRGKDLYFIYESMLRIKDLLDNVGSNGATMTNVNKTKFSNIRIFCPPEPLIDAFYDFCAPVFDNILTLSKSTVNAQQARDRLLPKLMSGEIEV